MHCFHRLMHTSLMYGPFHKQHHSYTNVVSVAAEYFHPVDYFFISLLPASIGPNLLGKHLHITTYLAWIIWQTLESADSHAGYEFPFSPFRLLPFSGSASYHDYHHTHNTGNYSSYFTVWDTILGSNKEYFEHQANIGQQLKDK